MSATLTLRRLRTLLSALAAMLFAGTIIELILEGHVKEPLQLAPFSLCGLGLAALAALRARPGRRTVQVVRAVMAAITTGSVVGVAVHVAGNLAFARETQPDAGAAGLLVAGLTGAAPPLAPGILAVAAVLVVTVTFAASGDPAPVAEPARTEAVAIGHAGRLD